LRLLPGRFMVIEQAMGMPRIRNAEAAAYLADFVEDMKRTGFVAEAMIPGTRFGSVPRNPCRPVMSRGTLHHCCDALRPQPGPRLRAGPVLLRRRNHASSFH
jgi:hypothetical protein